jgi:hypothetical protein
LSGIIFESQPVPLLAKRTGAGKARFGSMELADLAQQRNTPHPTKCCSIINTAAAPAFTVICDLSMLRYAISIQLFIFFYRYS